MDAGRDAGLDASDSGTDADRDAGLDASDSGTDSGLTGGAWQPLANQPTFGADTPFLLTDGRVAVHEAFDGTWWALTPDANDSYVNGMWSTLASMPCGYGPEYFGSAILGDGRLIVVGGEYNSCHLSARQSSTTDAARAGSRGVRPSPSLVFVERFGLTRSRCPPT